MKSIFLWMSYFNGSFMSAYEMETSRPKNFGYNIYSGRNIFILIFSGKHFDVDVI